MRLDGTAASESMGAPLETVADDEEENEEVSATHTAPHNVAKSAALGKADSCGSLHHGLDWLESDGAEGGCDGNEIEDEEDDAIYSTASLATKIIAATERGDAQEIEQLAAAARRKVGAMGTLRDIDEEGGAAD